MQPTVHTHPEHQAANLISPQRVGSSTTLLPMVIAVTTTAAAAQLPDEWQGCHVTLKMIGADVYWYFVEATAAPTGASLPDSSQGASADADGYQNAQLGWRTRDGEVDPEKVPRAAAGSHIYLCHDGSGAGTLWVKVTSTP